MHGVMVGDGVGRGKGPLSRPELDGLFEAWLAALGGADALGGLRVGAPLAVSECG